MPGGINKKEGSCLWKRLTLSPLAWSFYQNMNNAVATRRLLEME